MIELSASQPILYSTPLPIFVYGTLRTGQHNWRRLLAGRTVREQPAIAPNHVLYTLDVPYVVDGAGTVIGSLIELPPNRYTEIVRDLDALEEFDPITGNGHYLRVARMVRVAEEHVLAWVYHGSPVALSRCTAADWVPSGDWLARC